MTYDMMDGHVRQARQGRKDAQNDDDAANGPYGEGLHRDDGGNERLQRWIRPFDG